MRRSLRWRRGESILPPDTLHTRGTDSHETQRKVCDPHDKSFIYNQSSSQIKTETRGSHRLQTSGEGGDRGRGGGTHTRFEIIAATSAFLLTLICFRTLQDWYEKVVFREKKKAVGVKGKSKGFRSVSHTGILCGCTDLHKSCIRLSSRSLTW